jgi:hypothetical protein
MLSAAFPALAQVVPQGEQGELPLVIGAGFSDYRLDWGDDNLGHRRPILGGTVWIDYYLGHVPRSLSGLGLEVEGTDLSLSPPIELSLGYVLPNCTPPPSGPNTCVINATMRHDTAEGGVIYKYRHLGKIEPYGKVLFGFGSIDFPNTYYRPDGTLYSHDTRTLFSPGAGVEYRQWRHVAIRLDYEYQFWPDFLGHPHALNPSGFSLGATYSVRPFHRHGFIE